MKDEGEKSWHPIGDGANGVIAVIYGTKSLIKI